MATTNSNFKVKNGLDAVGVVTSAGLTLSSTTSPLTLNANAGTSGDVLISGGTGATPSWLTSTGSGNSVRATSPTFATSIIGSASMDVFNTVSTTVNAFGAATALTIGNGGSGNKTLTIQPSASTGTNTINIGTGTVSTASIAINIGTATISSGSVTTTIGSASSTTTINGSLTSPVPTLPSQTANTFLASPNSAAGTPSFRVLSYRDIYPAGLPTTFGQVIEYAPVGGGMGWTSSAPLLKGGGTMTGAFVGTTTTTSIAPIRLPSGTVPTTASQEFGMVAADAESLQLSTTKTTGAGPGFGIVRAPQMVFSLANAPTSATTTTGVAAFAAANDVLSSLEANKLYRFRGKYYVTYTAGGTAGALQMLFAFANAPQAINYNFRTTKSTSATTMNQVGIAAVATGVSVSTSDQTSGTLTVEFDGYFTSNATTGGTLTPQIAASVASLSGGSFVVTTGSWFEVEKIGSATQTLIAGNWA